MKRIVLFALAGIAVLLGGSLALLTWISAEPPPAVAPSASAADLTPAIVAPPANVTPPRALPPSLRRATAGAARAVPKSPVQDPSAPPLASRVVGKAIHKALLAPPVQTMLARCVDRETGYGGRHGAGRAPRAQPAVLLLELEARPGEAQIVDATVQRWGAASPAVVTCARDVLRGQVIRDPVIAAAPRLRTPFTLNPRSEVVATSR